MSTESRTGTRAAIHSAPSSDVHPAARPAASPTGPVRVLAAAGLLLFASAAVHAVVFLASGTPWEGPVSWRKPITFGLSFGLTAVTLAWIGTRLRLGRRTGWLLLGGLAVLSVAETALITLQAWRGVPSHFNVSTPFDAAVFSAMGVIVAGIALILAALAVLSFTAARPGRPAEATAIRAGMAILVLGQLLGAMIIAAGLPALAAGTDRAGGPLVTPHGIALHAVQVLPALAWLAYRAPWPESRRRRAVRTAAIGYGLVLAMAAAQAAAGRTALEPGLPLVLAGVGVALVVVAAARMVLVLCVRPDVRPAGPAAAPGPGGSGSSGGSPR